MIYLFLFSLLIATPIYLVYLFILYLTKKRTTWKLSTCLIELALCIYFVALLQLTDMFKIRISNFSEFHAAPNLVPLINTLKEVINYGFYVLKQVGLNVLLFVPFGFLLTLLKQRASHILIATLLISTTIEILQYFNGRFADIDDVIWNVSGALIGYLIYKLIKKGVKRH